MRGKVLTVRGASSGTISAAARTLKEWIGLREMAFRTPNLYRDENRRMRCRQSNETFAFVTANGCWQRLYWPLIYDSNNRISAEYRLIHDVMMLAFDIEPNR